MDRRRRCDYFLLFIKPRESTPHQTSGVAVTLRAFYDRKSPILIKKTNKKTSATHSYLPEANLSTTAARQPNSVGLLGACPWWRRSPPPWHLRSPRPPPSWRRRSPPPWHLQSPRPSQPPWRCPRGGAGRRPRGISGRLARRSPRGGAGRPRGISGRLARRLSGGAGRRPRGISGRLARRSPRGGANKREDTIGTEQPARRGSSACVPRRVGRRCNAAAPNQPSPAQRRRCFLHCNRRSGFGSAQVISVSVLYRYT